MDRGAWRATVNSIANNQTRLKLKRLSTLDLRGIWKLSFTSFIYLTKVLNVLSTEIQKESIKSISSLLDKVKKKKSTCQWPQKQKQFRARVSVEIELSTYLKAYITN